MNELNKIRGFMLPATPGEKQSQSLSGVKYFLIGLDNRIFLTSNLALIQFLFSHNESIDRLYDSASRHLSKLTFVDKPIVSPITDFPQPELLPFYNQKCFTITLKVLSNKTSEPGIEIAPKDQSYTVFALDDDVLIPLHAFFTTYTETVKNTKRRSELLNTKLELYSQDDELNSLETLTYKKHLENYKMKMRLLIQKMETDEREIKEGIPVVVREVLDEGSSASDEKGSKLVKLSNGSLFAGSFKNGRPDGSGKEFLPDGSSYVGDFKNGYWHGSGYLVDSENYICYGEFYEGRVVGI